MCICITDSLFCIAETNTTLEINYTPIKINLKKHNGNALVYLHDQNAKLKKCKIKPRKICKTIKKEKTKIRNRTVRISK